MSQQDLVATPLHACATEVKQIRLFVCVTVSTCQYVSVSLTISVVTANQAVLGSSFHTQSAFLWFTDG